MYIYDKVLDPDEESLLKQDLLEIELFLRQIRDDSTLWNDINRVDSLIWAGLLIHYDANLKIPEHPSIDTVIIRYIAQDHLVPGCQRYLNQTKGNIWPSLQKTLHDRLRLSVDSSLLRFYACWLKELQIEDPELERLLFEKKNAYYLAIYLSYCLQRRIALYEPLLMQDMQSASLYAKYCCRH